MLNKYYNPHEEKASRKELGVIQLKKFNILLEKVLKSNPFYQEKMKKRSLPSLPFSSLKELETIPFTTKEEIYRDQQSHSPYGSNLTFPLKDYTRFHQTSGSTGIPLKWLDTKESWQWIVKCWEIIYHAVGVEKGDRLFYPFSFGPFLGFWAAFEGAESLGYMVIPGGGMTSEGRLKFILDHKVTHICCTPTYGLRLAKTAGQRGINLSHSLVKALIVAGEPGGSLPAIRKKLEKGWGAKVYDHSGMTEIGSLGIECGESEGNPHLIESECIVEVINPDTGKQVEDEAEGELVITNLGRLGSPLIRYKTGDRVLLTKKPCSCGRNFVRMLGGIRGRQDQMIFIRGNNVYPSAIENIVESIEGIDEYQMIIEKKNEMNHLRIEIEINTEHHRESTADELFERESNLENRF